MDLDYVHRCKRNIKIEELLINLEATLCHKYKIVPTLEGRIKVFFMQNFSFFNLGIILGLFILNIACTSLQKEIKQKPNGWRQPKKQPPPLARQCRQNIEVSVGYSVIQAFVFEHVALTAYHNKNRDIEYHSRAQKSQPR